MHVKSVKALHDGTDNGWPRQIIEMRISNAAITAAPTAKLPINNSNQTELIEESQRMRFTLGGCTV